MPEPPPSRGVAARLFWPAVAVVLVPLAIHAVRLALLGGTYAAYSDTALIELHTRDVGHHAVLVGPYSRFGWNHPGPLLYYVLAVPYRLAGSRGIALPLTAAALNAASIVAIAWLARRRGGPLLGLAAAFLAGVLARGLGLDVLAHEWNPHVTLLPFAVTALLLWCAACGDRWALPAAAVTATFVVQSHLGYAPVVGALAVWAGAWIVAGARRRGDLGRLAVPAAAALGALVVLWLPPAVQQVREEPGNLGEILRFAREPHDEVLGAGDAARLVAAALGPRPDWVAGARPPLLGDGAIDLDAAVAVPVGLALLGAAAWYAWRRRDRTSLVLLGGVAVALVPAWLAAARVVGTPYPYLVRWLDPLGFLAALAVAAPVVRRVAEVGEVAAPRARDALAVALAAAVAALVLAQVPGAATGRLDASTTSRMVDTLADGTERALPDSGTVLVRGASTLLSRQYEAGLVLELTRRGHAVRVPDWQADEFGERRVLAGAAPARTLLVAGDARYEALRRDPDYELVADADPVAPDVRRALDRFDDLDASAQDALLRSLRGRVTERVGVFLVRADGA